MMLLHIARSFFELYGELVEEKTLTEKCTDLVNNIAFVLCCHYCWCHLRLKLKRRCCWSCILWINEMNSRRTHVYIYRWTTEHSVITTDHFTIRTDDFTIATDDCKAKTDHLINTKQHGTTTTDHLVSTIVHGISTTDHLIKATDNGTAMTTDHDRGLQKLPRHKI